MNRLDIFDRYRSLMFAIAYRMLGSVTDAEDIIQEAWIRWQNTQSIAHSPKSFLAKIVTRLCIDRLRAAKLERDRYTGIWLPEPMMTTAPDDPDHAELSESLSFAFLMLLECLSPTERAVFLLREVFDYDYTAISQTVGKSIPNCRKIVSRARQHLVMRRPEISINSLDRDVLVDRFLECWNCGDVPGLIALMAEDATFWADGGGKAIAVQKPLSGCRKIAHFLVAIRRSRLTPNFVSQVGAINARSGIINTVDEIPHSTFSFEFNGDRIQTIFAVVNPDKLETVKYRSTRSRQQFN
jgi:RNA polymerase sigma-70 factor, ECF subfamily